MSTPEGWKQMNFTKEKFNRLKAAHKKAVEEKQEQFTFEGEVFVTAFAKYFIEHHQPKFK